MFGFLLFLLVPSPLAHAGRCLPQEGICEPVDFEKARASAETEEGCFPSKSLESPVCYSVTFPAGYPFKAPAPYGIYLHGRGGDHKQFSYFAKECAEKEEPIFGEEGVPFLVVAPNQTFPTYWKNSVSGKKVASMVTRDLVRHVQKSTHVAHTRSERAILGISMGGHGATFLALKNPKVFSALEAISPIFRAEKDLLPEDRDGFGSGEQYLKNDPATIALEQGMPSGLAFHMQIAIDDGLLIELEKTQDFFEKMSARYPDRVMATGTGGHSTKFWCGALRRSMNSLRKELKAQ